MQQVPTEIWSNIFSHLHQSDLVTCMCTCDSWNNIIKYYTLYHAICSNSSDRLKKLVTSLQDSPKIAYKINDIALYFKHDSDTTDLGPFLSSLKHIKRLFFNDDLNTQYDLSQVHYQLHDNIEYISEHSDYSLAKGILSTGICPMLVTLKIHTVAQNIISLLKNAPALKRLSFCPGITSFSDLNTIHTSLIDLESLEIRNSTIEILGFDEITDPATSIVECIFLDVTLTVPKNIWEYIDQKYPNVSSISCNCYRFPFTTMIFDQGIYDGWMKLFQGLKSQLKRISHFDEATDQDIFEVMDIQNCGLDYLQLVEFRQPSLQKLIVSSQVLSLETLVLRDTSIDSYEWLSHLQPIRKFKLICPVPADQPLSPILNLNDVLDNCPSQLVSLTINSVAITGDIRSSTPTNIKSLSFVFGTLPINIDESISIRFPKLSKLKLKSCNLYERKFNLSKLSLASFHYNDHYFATDGQITGDCKVLISTLDNLEQRLYEFKAVHDVDTIKPFKTFSEYLKFSPMHETDAVPTFTMVCNSLGIFNSS